MAEIMKLVESLAINRTDIPSFSPGDTIKVHVKEIGRASCRERV